MPRNPLRPERTRGAFDAVILDRHGLVWEYDRSSNPDGLMWWRRPARNLDATGAIPRMLRGDVSALFGPITWAYRFHDSRGRATLVRTGVSADPPPPEDLGPMFRPAPPLDMTYTEQRAATAAARDIRTTPIDPTTGKIDEVELDLGPGHVTHLAQVIRDAHTEYVNTPSALAEWGSFADLAAARIVEAGYHR